MLDPDNIAKFDCDVAELQERILFWTAAAGKPAHTTARVLDTLLTRAAAAVARKYNPTYARALGPYGLIVAGYGHGLPSLRRALRACGFGCYNQRARSFAALINSPLVLGRCHPDELMQIPGIGFKTARGFVLYTREHARYAVLDRHVLRFMREHGLDAPASSPQSATSYASWEQRALDMADRMGLSPLEFDRMIWLRYRVPPKQESA